MNRSSSVATDRRPPKRRSSFLARPLYIALLLGIVTIAWRVFTWQNVLRKNVEKQDRLQKLESPSFISPTTQLFFGSEHHCFLAEFKSTSQRMASMEPQREASVIFDYFAPSTGLFAQPLLPGSAQSKAHLKRFSDSVLPLFTAAATTQSDAMNKKHVVTNENDVEAYAALQKSCMILAQAAGHLFLFVRDCTRLPKVPLGTTISHVYPWPSQHNAMVHLLRLVLHKRSCMSDTYTSVGVCGVNLTRLSPRSVEFLTNHFGSPEISAGSLCHAATLKTLTCDQILCSGGIYKPLQAPDILQKTNLAVSEAPVRLQVAFSKTQVSAKDGSTIVSALSRSFLPLVDATCHAARTSCKKVQENSVTCIIEHEQRIVSPQSASDVSSTLTDIWSGDRAADLTVLKFEDAGRLLLIILVAWVQSSLNETTVSFEKQINEAVAWRERLQAELLRSVPQELRLAVFLASYSFWTLNLICLDAFYVCPNDSQRKTVTLLPGPFVRQSERMRAERVLADCFRMAGCDSPTILWYRPDDDTHDFTADDGDEYTSDGFALIKRRKIDAGRVPTPLSRIAVPLKDATELSVEVALSSAPLFRKFDRAISATRQRLLTRFYPRTMYDPDFFIFRAEPVEDWVVATTSAVLQDNSVCATQKPSKAQPVSLCEWRSNVSSTIKTIMEKGQIAGLLSWSVLVPPVSTNASASDDLKLAGVGELIRMREDFAALPPLTRNASSQQKKIRKKKKILGDSVETHVTFAWYTENRDEPVHLAAFLFNDTNNISESLRDHTLSLSSCPAGDLHWFTYMHYPWVLDNVYHLHNDNLLPLTLAIKKVEKEFSTTHTSQQHCRRLVLLPRLRTKQPLPFALDLFRLLFDEVVVMSRASFERFKGLRGASSCQVADLAGSTDDKVGFGFHGSLVFGRPRRPFSAEMADVIPYRDEGVFEAWRVAVMKYKHIATHTPSLLVAKEPRSTLDAIQLRWLRGVANPLRYVPPAPAATRVVVTWIVRLGERSLQSDAALLAWIIQSGNASISMDVLGCGVHCTLHLQLCCEGLSYMEQIELIHRTDILVGVHGAGLLHLIHMNAAGKVALLHGKRLILHPLVVHIGSVRLNYHEQTIIERLAFLSTPNASRRIRFLSTLTTPKLRDVGASWHASFQLDMEDIRDLWAHVIYTYFVAV